MRIMATSMVVGLNEIVKFLAHRHRVREYFMKGTGGRVGGEFPTVLGAKF